MIDFDALVLAPAMTAFARPIVVTPVMSQPGAAAFGARGVWEIKNIDVQTEEGIYSGQRRTLGVRLSEFAVPPVQGDRVDIPAYLSRPAEATHVIDDVDDDGQGGSTWTMKQVTSP
jgi:hypothetical protein